MITFKIEISCDDFEVRDLILQDPMGELNHKFPVRIGDKEFLATCEGYTATEGCADLILYSEE